MIRINGGDDVQKLLMKTGHVLTPNQRIVVMVYASSEQNPDGTVMTRALDLATVAGMKPPVFSRTRRELVEEGWLEERGSFGQVKLYRLNPEKIGDIGGRHLHAVGS
ncbi:MULTISPECIES: helix-turn-helix transcriptional regulator [unclassified Streptomyces]|uniref:helix-turn-helix transcriptional regulator n=1 Tax=unclassified Streptomyces TaxID=2593676 RepID=UPI002E21016C|nr:ArsR family transcriptional regulator [Streptomyces sp. NBC_01023]